MKLSWKMGTVFGIPVRLHVTMLLLPFIRYNPEITSNTLYIAIWLGSIALIFGSVLLHELGHALTARRYGIRTQDIILTPIGGIARIMNLPESPRQEITIAIAGPLVSIGLAALTFALAAPIIAMTDSIAVVFCLQNIIYINAILGLFNLIPALPMDGGRVLRGLLELRRDHLTATRIAVKVGRTLAVLGAIAALVWLDSNGTVLVISGFIYIMAGNELRMAEMKAVRERMAREAQTQSSTNDGWPWDVYGRQGVRAAPPEPRPYSAQSPTTKDGWNETPPKRKRDVLVVKGGKVEILSRKDTKEE